MTVKVGGYVKNDGTKVDAYRRHKPKKQYYKSTRQGAFY